MVADSIQNSLQNVCNHMTDQTLDIMYRENLRTSGFFEATQKPSVTT